MVFSVLLKNRKSKVLTIGWPREEPERFSDWSGGVSKGTCATYVVIVNFLIFKAYSCFGPWLFVQEYSF